MGRIVCKAVLLVACFLALTGCPRGGTKVFIKQTSYNPSFETANLSAYKGKTLYFSSVTNNAANTSIWDYYSTDSQYAYEASPSLQTYFWDCFIKSFHRIGVKTLVTPWSAGTETAPELQIVLNSVSDQKFVFSVNLIKPGQSTFQKEYTVESPPAGTADPAALEKRGYRLVDAAFAEMVGDPGFRKAFLKK
ncbi:MAG: hypothetical protein AUK27_05760 [Deltaproteobacteria bacterium CG2_30_66_27]|nr:MAG: hypothetical protein AUK27_05760 [Deltaproteobacteria bacterium CG2_30_66_27]PJB32416.1 MAG: hypothetical protein CO109_04715 [Deltaproteobacteria bacterium CG_4_9_14_3_um_filter_65_9]